MILYIHAYIYVIGDNQEFQIKEWAEPDLDRRPLARKANVLTRLDDQPTDFQI